MGAPDVYGPNGAGFQSVNANYDNSLIGIDVVTAGSGNNCKAGDWATIHWTASLKDGRVVSDSRAEPGGRPKTFAVGASEVFKCWDLGVQELKQGEKAVLHCPSYLSWGGAYTQAPLGGEPIPLNSDIDFEVEVMECNRVPEAAEMAYYYSYYASDHGQPRTTTMQPSRDFWLHLEESDQTANDMVLTEQDGVAIIHHKEKLDLAQQWSIDANGAIKNSGTGKYLGESATKGGNLGDNKLKWYFDPVAHTLTTAITDWVKSKNFDGNHYVSSKYLCVPKEHMMPGSETQVQMARFADAASHRWRIEYVGAVNGH